MKDALPARVRLGAVEVNLRVGELREGERTMLLQDQPFQILQLLIERGGELVTREEIKKKFWPNDTVVEFDHSINAAIRKLRRALDDSADDPKYIETIPRRGYRLMVPVERLVCAEVSLAEALPQVADNAASRLPKPPDSGALVGRTVSHYRVLDIIGGGGMGVVYRAEDLKLGRRVALKFLPEEMGTDLQALERFSREARAISSLDHPNICTIHEFGEHEGRPFMVMQLLQGQTLRDRLAPGDGPLPLTELLDIGVQISAGLQAAHERGIIHRDIKPANIFITDKGVCKILDFGVAKLLEPGDESELVLQAGIPISLPAESGSSHLTRTGSAMGTAGYMSPEQVRGEKLDARTDLFSFGLVLYEMATGQRAFGGETAAIVHDAILNHPAVPVRELNPVLPGKLVATIDRALEKDRGLRYQSGTEMRADLEQVRNGKRARARLHWTRIAAAGLLVIMVVISGLYWRSRNAMRLTDNDTIVLADFTNLTTDPVFDDALNAALRVELEQTPFLNLLAADKVRGTLKAIHHSDDEKLTSQLARDVCVHTNSKAYVAGSISDLGNHYGIELRSVDCRTGKTFAKAAVEAKDREQVVKMLGVAGIDLRRTMGEPQSVLQKFNQPLEQATTTSPDALQAYSQGQQIRWLKGDAEALPYLKRAVQIDGNFAAAYASIGIAYVNQEQPDLGTENFKKAYELIDRTSARQRLYIEGSYYGLVTGEIGKAIQIFTKWVQIYPADQVAHGGLSRLLRVNGQYEMAIAEAKETLRLAPENYPPVFNLMASYMALNRLDEAKTTFDEARSRGIDVPLLRLFRYYLGFLQNDQAAMQEQVAWASDKAAAEPLFSQVQSQAYAYHGQLINARDLLQRMLKSSRPTAGRELAAYSLMREALWDVEVGNKVRARKEIGEVLQLMPNRDMTVEGALILTRAGDVVSAQKLVDELSTKFPVDTMMQNYSLPTIRAAMELQERNPAKAIVLLQTVTPYELALSGLYPAYVRGLAYLDAGLPHQAATEFQKLIDHPGIVLTDIPGALSHLQLGRAQVMMGEKAAARKSYQDFLTLWKDADPDIPIYKQAKLEYAKLH